MDAADAVEDVVAAVAAVAPIEVVTADIVPVSGGLAASLDGGGQTRLPTNPAEGVGVTSPRGDVVLSFSLPAAADLDDAVVATDGSVTYLGVDAPSVNVVAADDEIRVSTVIPGLYWWVDTYTAGVCR